ncbi:MAG: beta-ketoacyl-[acyl-carrier-protein] synthase II [Myxococcales bacterium]|nr:beta-ketoacyl-[acyl-carrier-protein] synthase II [Myxococcales bacterium]
MGQVAENAAAGADCFSDSSVFADLPFSAPVGAMRDLTATDGVVIGGARTRVMQVALPSVIAIAPAVTRAVARWGAARVGYIFASSTGGLEQTEQALLATGEQGASPSRAGLYADHAMNATSDAIAAYWGISGYRFAVSTACSSSLKAAKSALRLIEAGLADAVVVGCADSLCRTTLMGFNSLGILSSSPTRPFSAERAGITIGEGSAYILIEREAPRAETLCVLAGLGESADAFHPSSPDPEAKGAIASMAEAIANAGLVAGDIDYVSAHGTGTQQNDAMESLAIRTLCPGAPVSGTKALTGHTLGAAGLTSLVLAIESLRRQTCLPTPRAMPVDESLGLTIVHQAQRRALRHVLVNSFAFGGNNCTAVISVAVPPNGEALR